MHQSKHFAVTAGRCRKPSFRRAQIPRNRKIPGNLAQICGSLRDAYEEFRPDIVHCWSDLANVVGGFSAASFDIARIVLGQRTFPPIHYVSAEEADLYRKAYRVLLRIPPSFV